MKLPSSAPTTRSTICNLFSYNSRGRAPTGGEVIGALLGRCPERKKLTLHLHNSRGRVLQKLLLGIAVMKLHPPDLLSSHPTDA